MASDALTWARSRIRTETHDRSMVDGRWWRVEVGGSSSRMTGPTDIDTPLPNCAYLFTFGTRSRASMSIQEPALEIHEILLIKSSAKLVDYF
jgi:hypothetical protein